MKKIIFTIVVETSPNKIFAFTEKGNKWLPYIKNHLIEITVYLSFKSQGLNW